MPRGNLDWMSIDIPGSLSPTLKITLKRDTKTYLEFEAEIQGKSLSTYCREVLEQHVRNVEMCLNGGNTASGDVLP